MNRMDQTVRWSCGWMAAALLMFCLPSLHAAQPSTRLLVLPFNPLSPDAPAWIAQAVQSDQVARLGRSSGMEVVAGNQPALNPQDALAAAGRHQAQKVVFGSYQAVDDQLRFTGQVLDVETGKGMGSMTATGPLRDLFALEDQLSDQVGQLLNGTSATAQPSSAVPTTGPVRRGAYGPYGAFGLFDGSSLQRAIQSGQVNVPPPPKLEDENNSSYWYRFGTTYWMGGYGYPFYYYPFTRSYTYPWYYRVVPRRPFVPYRTPPSPNVQGYFPMTLIPPK